MVEITFKFFFLFFKNKLAYIFLIEIRPYKAINVRFGYLDYRLEILWEFNRSILRIAQIDE